MITINGTKFYEKPTICSSCPACIIGREDSRGWCSFFDKRKARYDSIPARCDKLFDKAFSIGGDFVITIK